MSKIANISCYKFAPLTDLKPLRERLIARCKALGLKGTILLSTEGINLFLAGQRESIDEMVAEIRSINGLADLAPKYSDSDDQPFTRMLVRIKKEIIAFGVEGIDPARYTSPRMDARTLKQWLDEGRPVTLLDTRNDYEVKLGTFKGAIPIHVDHFRDFPEAVRKLPPELKEQPIVTFCTGGVRCEKAAPFMEREGFKHIWQLDGGILKYFEECGHAHYDGECFVFDQRVGVDPSLRETDSAICFACQTPLDADEQKDPRFVPNVSCPYCFKTTEQQMHEAIEARHAAIRRLTTPLPGSVPYENRRPLNVPGEFDGQTLIDFLCTIFPHIEREEWQRRCELGRFRNDEGPRSRDIPVPSNALGTSNTKSERRDKNVPAPCESNGRTIGADYIVRAGERCVQIIPGTVEPDVNVDIRILHEDEAIIVLHKPAPLPTHPSGRFNRNTLQHILCEAYAPQRPKFAHRLDANTTGLVVCARTRHFAALLQQQFRRGGIEKVYLARVQGHPPQDEFVCEAPISDEPGELGSHAVDETEGQASRTEFKVLRRDSDGTALVEARPITGRTNQIRVHLWHLGFPICGDAAYLPEGKLGDTQTLDTDAKPLCLHAWRLAFDHPITKQRMTFETARPEWAPA